MSTNRILQRFSNRGLVDFDTTLEASYQDYRHQKNLQIVPNFVIISTVVLVIFALSDLAVLPDEWATNCALMRLLINIPLVLSCSLAAQLKVRQGFFDLLIGIAYLSVGWVVVYVIYLAETAQFPLPHEGIFIVLLFGFFLLQQRLRVVCLLCGVISISYLMMLQSMEKPATEILYAILFVISFNFAGLGLIFIHDRSRRELFLNEQVMISRKEKDQQDIEQRKQLAATASHDLRQPLQGLNLLVENWLQTREGKDHHFAQKIKDGLGHVNRLLNGLFSLSHIENGDIQVRYEEIQLHEFLEEIVREERARMEEKGIEPTLICSQSIQVCTDPILLGRIVRNILHNTIDHSGASEFKLSARTERDRCILMIVDNGRGVDPSQLARLKTRFIKGPSKTKTGLGVGLFIIEQLSQRLGMFLKVRTQFGGGFRYQMSLPTVSAPTIRRKAALIPDAQRAQNGRLLIAENDEMILDGLKSMCQQGGFSGEAYAQGNALLSNRQFPRYDCMVTDYHLDPYTGVELINHVRAHSHVTLPAIVLTADTTITAERIAASISHGPSVAVYYKPLTREALFEAITSAMDQKRI